MPNCSHCAQSAYQLGNQLHLQSIVGYRRFGQVLWPQLARVVQHGKELHLSISCNGYEYQHQVTDNWSTAGTWYRGQKPSTAEVC